MIKKIFVYSLLIVFLLQLNPPVYSQSSSPTIRWYDWSEEAFKKAKSENKPILLNLTTTWCHWCHVMDQEAYEDEEVIWLANQMFVPIRVDADQRVDVNERYNMGGWPSTVFLTPQGNVLVGSTFLTAEEMRLSLPNIIDLYQKKGEEFDKTKNNENILFGKALQQQIESSENEDFAPSFIDKIMASLLISTDDLHGGMGERDKSPIPEVTEFLFLLSEVSSDEKVKRVLRQFLEGQNKLFDSVAGGFFRYTDKRDWTEPQYEKLLSTNAFLLRDLIWGKTQLDREEDILLIDRTLDYLKKNLWDKPLGGFFGSQNSDLTIRTSGLNQKEQSVRIPGKVYYSYSEAERAELGVPLVDRHVFTDSCSQIVSSLLEGARKNSDAELGKIALRAVDFLQKTLFAKGLGMKHGFPATDKPLFSLKDQVWYLKALLDAYEYSQNKKYWNDFITLLPIVERQLGTPEGVFYDFSEEETAFGNLKRREVPLVENCLMARIYLKVFRMKGKEVYRNKSKAILNFFAPRYQQYSFFSAAYGSALIDWFYPMMKMKIVGKPNSEQLRKLTNEAFKLPGNRIDFEVLELEDARKELEPLGIQLLEKSNPQIVICVGEKCLTPESSPEKLLVQFELAQNMVRAEVLT